MLHEHENLMLVQPLTTKYAPMPSTPDDTLKNPYWGEKGFRETIKTYMVSESITIIPGIGEYGRKVIQFPASFQDTSDGVRTIALAAAGVIAKSHFRVMPVRSDQETNNTLKGEQGTHWILRETAQVECAKCLMPIVKGNYEKAHRDLCSRLLEKASQGKRGQAGSS